MSGETFSPRAQAQNELDFLTRTWSSKWEEYERLAEEALKDGDEVKAGNYKVLANMLRSDAAQVSFEAEQMRATGTRDGEIPTFSPITPEKNENSEPKA